MKNHNNVLFRIRKSFLNSLSYSLRSAKDSTENSGSFNLNFGTTIKCIQKQIAFVFLFMLISYNAFANNISITPGSVILTGKDIASHFTLVQFDLTWENSWRTSKAPYNWDAAWVFVKYRVAGTNVWHHASLNDVNHTAPDGSTIDIGLLTPATAFDPTINPGLGAFIYSSAEGSEVTNIFNGVQLCWNYGANSVADDAVVDIEVFAIEMVYVPQGNFYVGSGGTENFSFTTANSTLGATVPFQITSTAPTLQGNNGSSSENNLSARGNLDLTGTTTATLATGFPTGYSAYYCMKYEISQQQYVDFLNTLTYTQQSTRTANPPTSTPGTGALDAGNSARNGIDIQTSGAPSTTPAVYACNLDGDGNYSETNDGQWIACNFLSWADMAAYLDWSGLRPMTELEFEKSCRGTGSASPNEYAWGSTSYTHNTGISNSGLTNETSTNGGNITYGTAVPGPMRVGAFATSSSIRVTAGATYYGIMEMSGNVAERPVTVGNTEGRSFTGTHGNGELYIDGNADVSYWPSNTTAVGAGLRGGDWNTYYVDSYPRVSDRYNATYSVTSDVRPSDVGGRGVRTAPVIYNIVN
jgi:formylglycine-generating enzyme required for sulfatase activity